MTRIETFHWNPMRPKFRGKISKRIPLRTKLNNFGDLLGPMIVNEIVNREELVDISDAPPQRLLSVGSILHFARDGDVVWGSGINGKSLHEPPKTRDIDVRSVRGPLTAEYLKKHGIDAPASYGDPGLLVSTLWPEYGAKREPGKITVVMNFNDAPEISGKFDHLNPRSPVEHCVRQIAGSSLVIGSSLHAIVVAESFGVPARLIRSSHEPQFKYDDYYAGTGRKVYDTAENVMEAVSMGGERPPVWSPEALLQSFPRDLWKLEVNR